MIPAVLLVCDHPGLRLELAGLLRSAGSIELVEAASGEDALRQLLKQDMALVLMMLDMPGMDGIEMASLMRANPKTRHVPLLLAGGDGDAARAYAAGCNDYLRMPIDRAALKARLATFTLLFQQRQELDAQQAPATPVRRHGRGADGLRLLLVDDRPENLVALDALLGDLEGVELVHAESGPDCLRAVLRQDFAAILLDVQMPGMDGFQTAELLRANPKTSGMPIIFVTAGLGGREAQFKGYELGVVDYLIKPLEPAILNAKVRVFCDLYRQRIALEEQAESLARLVADRDRALARSTENLADSRARYQRLLGAVTHQLFSVQRGDDGQLQSFGHGAGCEAITGYPSSAFGDDPRLWLMVIPEPERSQVATLANEALNKGESGHLEHRVRTSEGAMRWVRTTFVQGATDGAAMCDVLMEDIDARHLAEDERARIGETLALATRAAGLGIWDWDLVTSTLRWDDRMYALCGVQRGQLGDAHQTWLATTLPEDQPLCEAALQRTVRDGANYEIELRVRWPDGTLRYLRADGQVQRDAQGRALRMTGVHFDITERKQAEFDLLRHRDHLLELVDERTASLRAIIAEQKLTEAKLVAARGAAEAANQVKSEFLAKMSHELRTPLNAVIGFSRLAVKAGGLSGDQQENLEIIHRSGQHLLTLINDVLQLSKIESGRMWLSESDVDLGGVLREVVEMLTIRARQGGLALELVMDAVPDVVRVDAVKLRQVLINLLGNALKFTMSGTVKLEVRAQPAADGVTVRFEVSDTGIGIAPEYCEAVFEPFFQMDNHATAAGTGLGLAISRQYVQMMGGDMTLVSTPGAGSTFGFTLKLAIGEAGAQSARGVVAGLAQQQRGMGILVADDDPVSRKLIVALLEPLGFKVVTAVDGMDALVQLDQFSASLIVLDWRMPRLDGLETIGQIRQRSDCHGVPIVICSASAFEEQCNAALKAGANAYLRKPLIEEELFAVLEEQLGLSFMRAGAVPALAEAGPPLVRADLAGLPEAVRQSLRSGAVELDHAKLDRAIAQVRVDDEVLAARIMAMTLSNQLRQLWELLDDAN
jgi:signal transduction histidine kinase/CheY-like chemotaxis protein